MCNCNRNCGGRCCCPMPPFPPIPPIPPAPNVLAENVPYPSGFNLQAWNFPPEGAVSDFFIQNDMTLYTTLHINTAATVSEVLVLSSAFAGVIGPVYVGIYDANRQLIVTSGDVAANIQTSAEPVLSRLPLNATTTLQPGKYYVAFSIDLGGGQGFNLLAKINFMFLLQNEPYSNYFFTDGGPLPAILPFEANGNYGTRRLLLWLNDTKKEQASHLLFFLYYIFYFSIRFFWCRITIAAPIMTTFCFFCLLIAAPPYSPNHAPWQS